MRLSKWLKRLLALAAVVLAGACVAFAIKPTLFFDVGAEELAHSLSGEVDGGGDAECTARGDDLWRCTVSIGGSSEQNFELTNDEECWDAKPLSDEGKKRFETEGPYGEPLEGCVGFFDFTRLDDRVSGDDS